MQGSPQRAAATSLAAASSALLYVACGRVATLKTLARSDSSRGGLCGDWGRKLGKLLNSTLGRAGSSGPQERLRFISEARAGLGLRGVPTRWGCQ